MQIRIISDMFFFPFRMDFSSPVRSTFATTRLFNIIPGTPAANLFANPCPTGTSIPTPLTSGGSRSI